MKINSNIIILIIIASSVMVIAQTLNYAEDGRIGNAYPYKDYPPEVQTVRYFSLTQQYLLKDNPKNMMPTSNIIDLDGSYIKGNKFYLNLMEDWNFQSEESRWAREITPADIRYSIDEASKYLLTLSSLGIDHNTIDVSGDTKAIINANRQLNESDSLNICNALRRVIVVPAGSGENLDLFKNSPAGAGPFYETNRSGYDLDISSDETDDYFYGEPMLEGINIQRALQFQHETKLISENIDLMIDANIFNKLNLCEQGSYHCKSVASDFVNLLVLNHRSRKMSRKDFREALAHAIDKVELADLYDGSILNGSLSSRNIFSKNGIIPREFSLENSDKKLSSLGYYKDAAGFYVDPSTGDNVTLKFLYNRNGNMENIANIASYFEELGLRISRSSKSSMAIRRLLDSKSESDWDIYYRSEQLQSIQFVRGYYHSGETDNNNWGGYRNKTIDLLLDRFQAADGTEKLQLGPQIHQALYDDVAVIGLFVSPTYAIYQKYVKAFIVPWYYFDQPHKWSADK